MSDDTPRGVRDNNPCNLEASLSFFWHGQIGTDGPYCEFDIAEHGARAAGINLLAYQDHHGCRTLSDFIGRWAPPNENDTPAYIADVAARLGLDPAAFLDLRSDGSLAGLLGAIAHHEQGGDFWVPSVFADGAADALAAEIAPSFIGKVAP